MQPVTNKQIISYFYTTNPHNYLGGYYRSVIIITFSNITNINTLIPVIQVELFASLFGILVIECVSIEKDNRRTISM